MSQGEICIPMFLKLVTTGMGQESGSSTSCSSSSIIRAYLDQFMGRPEKWPNSNIVEMKPNNEWLMSPKKSIMSSSAYSMSTILEPTDLGVGPHQGCKEHGRQRATLPGTPAQSKSRQHPVCHPNSHLWGSI